MLVVYYKDYVDDKEVTVDHRLINPKIVSESVKKAALSGGEGCLSVDDSHPGYVYRPYKIIVKAFDAKNKLFKDEMDRLFQNRVLELEDKKIEISQKDIMNEIEILAKQIDDNNV